MIRPLLAFLLLINQLVNGQNFSSSEINTGYSKTHTYDSFFQKAYLQNPEIPKGVLEAIAFTTTRIHHLSPSSVQSCTGLPPVYGVMGLTLEGKNYFRNNLLYVSQLSGFSAEEIMNDPEKNILAFAKAYSMLLSTKNISGQNIENHVPVLTELSELPDNDLQTNFALNSHLYSVLSLLNNRNFCEEYNFPVYNINLIDVFGKNNYEVLSSSEVIISEDAIQNKEGDLFQKDNDNSSFQSTDYPPAIWNAAASCNYSSRGGTAVSAVVVHDVEGSYAGCISWFKNCSASVSAHYVIRSSDGQVTQMVVESNKAWHVGTHNPYTIGIEHEGYQAQTGWYTTAMYTSSANLVKDICNSGYGINPTTCYNGPSCSGICTLSTSFKIKGHQHYSGQTHNDPGPNWNWGTYYNLINGTNSSCGSPSGLSASAITSGGATLNWSAVSGAASYNLQYRKTGTTTWASSTSGTNSKTITGLSASTSYEFQVQAVCSGATGSFSAASTFTTLSASVINDNCSGAQLLTSGTSCVNTAGSIAGATASGLAKASCDVFSGTAQLKDVWFSFVANNPLHTITLTPSSGLDGVLALYTSCTGGQIGCSDNGGGGGGIEKITSTALTSGTTYYIRVYNYGSATPSTTGFNICITNPAPPSCGIPTNLSASSITSNSANLYWASVSGAVSYNVNYKSSASTIWTSATSTTNSKTISGLAASTTYEFKVQALCSGTSGSFSSSTIFTTSAGSATATITIGNGTNSYSAHPFGTVYMDERVEYIITKAELSAAGWNSSTPDLNSISFYVSSASAQVMNGFTITLGHTSSATFGSTSFLTGTNSTLVFTGNKAAVTGWNTYSFATPFTYNGTGNLLITICWNNSSYTSNSVVQCTSYSGYVALYYRADVTSGGVCAQSTGTRSYYRPNTKMTFSGGQVPPNSSVNCDLTQKTTIEGFNVYKHNPSGAIMYKAKMAIDADGSPRAYGPNNSGLDYTANAGSPGNWWGVVTDSNGNPVIQNSTDPYPGMYVSTTSLINSAYPAINPLRYTNSEAVPFFVLPSAVTSLGGISLGDIGYVYNTVTGVGTYAVFADGGPAGKLGEGSIYLANKLGINSNPKNGGTSSGIIDYIVFPQSGYGQGKIPSIAQIDSIGTIKINSVGGTGITNCLNNPSSNKMENASLGFDEVPLSKEFSVELFPNPSDGTGINLKVNGLDEDDFSPAISVSIFDLAGRKLFSGEIKPNTDSHYLSFKDASFLPGIYFVVFNTQGKHYSRRMIIH